MDFFGWDEFSHGFNVRHAASLGSICCETCCRDGLFHPSFVPKFVGSRDHREPLVLRLMAEIRLTTWDVWNPINNGKTIYLSTGAGFQPSTVLVVFLNFNVAVMNIENRVKSPSFVLEKRNMFLSEWRSELLDSWKFTFDEGLHLYIILTFHGNQISGSMDISWIDMACRMCHCFRQDLVFVLHDTEFQRQKKDHIDHHNWPWVPVETFQMGNFNCKLQVSHFPWYLVHGKLINSLFEVPPLKSVCQATISRYRISLTIGVVEKFCVERNL